MSDASAGARPHLSAILITRNEAANLPDCLASIAWCDEIVVVDAGSTDGTPDIARAAGALVIVTPDWPGFGAQKQRALDRARGEWVLSIDADERVDAALRDAIRAAIASPRFDAYTMPRRSLFVGRWMRHSGWWPDRVLRLARRDRARFSAHRVHERLDVDGTVGALDAPLLHYSYRDFDAVLAKQNAYSTAGAADLHARGRRSSLTGACLHAFATFVRMYVFKRGLLDGRYGFLVAVANAQGSFWKYIKLCEQSRVRQGPPPPT